MKTKALTPQGQIKLLTKIRNRISSYMFICVAYNSIRPDSAEYGELSPSEELHNLVPLFTFENAKQFGAKCDNPKHGSWWTISEVKLRIDFINWIIEENKKLINQ